MTVGSATEIDHTLKPSALASKAAEGGSAEESYNQTITVGALGDICCHVDPRSYQFSTMALRWTRVPSAQCLNAATEQERQQRII